jgi:transcriptional regulator with XRE-family HTH domain
MSHFVFVGTEQLKNQELIDQIVAKLKQLRTERGLTQEDVYNDTGIHIARIETGKVNISISTLAALASYFNISLEVFFQNINK